MNSITRVMNAITGEPVDRNPVIAVLSAYGARLSGQKIQEIFSNADCYLKAHAAVLETFPVDMALAPFDYCAIAEAFGGEIRFYDDQPANLKKPAAKCWQEVLNISLPDPRSTGRLPVALKAIEKLISNFGNDKPVFAAIPGPCSLPILIMGFESWLETFLFDREGADKVLAYTSKFWHNWAEELAGTGITGVMVTEGFSLAEICHRQLFEERVLPFLTEMLARLKIPKIFHHAGGGISHILDLVNNLDGITGIALGAKDNILEARNIVGREKLLLGNIDNIVFPSASREQIYDKSMEILNIMVGRGPFILANSGGDIPLNTPVENIQALFQAAIDKG